MNPTYAGAYTFGKTRDVRKVQPDGSVRTSRRKRAREQWTVLIEDHHEGYLSWVEYLDIEAKLAANNTRKRARPVREGTALCQGIIFCGCVVAGSAPGMTAVTARSLTAARSRTPPALRRAATRRRP